MKFAIRVDHYSDAPTEASRCPTCGRAMPVFDAMHAVLGPEGTGVVIRAIDFALTCPCGANLTLRLAPGFRLPSEFEGEDDAGRDTRGDN